MDKFIEQKKMPFKINKINLKNGAKKKYKVDIKEKKKRKIILQNPTFTSREWGCLWQYRHNVTHPCFKKKRKKKKKIKVGRVAG